MFPKFLDATNRFFTLIPHDFGMKSPPLLDNPDFIRCAYPEIRLTVIDTFSTSIIFNVIPRAIWTYHMI